MIAWSDPDWKDFRWGFRRRSGSAIGGSGQYVGVSGIFLWISERGIFGRQRVDSCCNFSKRNNQTDLSIWLLNGTSLCNILKLPLTWLQRVLSIRLQRNWRGCKPFTADWSLPAGRRKLPTGPKTPGWSLAHYGYGPLRTAPKPCVPSSATGSCIRFAGIVAPR